MEQQPSASDQADRAIERMRVREAEVMGHRLAALEAMRAQAQAQVDAAQEQMQVKKLERVDKAVRHDRRLKRVTNYKMAEDAKRSAKNIIQPDATWKLQKRLKERKLGAEKERRRAVRNIYEGGAQREAERCAKRDAARKKRWEAAMVKNEEEVKMPSREEIMRIAEERTRRDVAETRMRGAAKELGFASDVDPAVLEREVKKSIHFEVGERVYANGEGASTFERVPELSDKFKAIGTSDQRKREICDICHTVSMPLLKKCVGDHYDFFSREDIHRNGTLAEKAQDRKQLREAVEEVVRTAAKAGLTELSRDEAALRLDIEKLQKKLVSLGAPPDQLVVVPSWCSWARSRGSAAKAPLVVRRAALKGQLHGLRGDTIAEYDTPIPAIDFDLGPMPATGPRGYELERARKGRLGIALDGAGETTTAERARREARKQAELAEWAEREGLGHLLSPERDAAPAPAPLVEDAPPPPFSPRIDADAWLAAGLAPLSM